MGSDPLLDDDEKALAAVPGDGLTLFEEYRGLLIDGFHERIDPGIRDLFIHFADGSGRPLRTPAAGETAIPSLPTRRPRSLAERLCRPMAGRG